MRSAAARALGDIAPESPKVVSALRRAFKDDDSEVREAVAWALFEAGPAARPAVPELMGALTDSAPDERVAAACVLGGLGQTAKSATSEYSVLGRIGRMGGATVGSAGIRNRSMAKQRTKLGVPRIGKDKAVTTSDGGNR